LEDGAAPGTIAGPAPPADPDTPDTARFDPKLGTSPETARAAACAR
jgi:hypothetical protein